MAFDLGTTKQVCYNGNSASKTYHQGEKKMYVINVHTLEKEEVNSRKEILMKVYQNVCCQYDYFSPLFKAVLEEYKREKLTPHIRTMEELERIAKNPEEKDNIPRYEVRGFDALVTSRKFEEDIKKEFVNFYLNEEKHFVHFLNANHDDLRFVRNKSIKF